MHYPAFTPDADEIAAYVNIFVTFATGKGTRFQALKLPHCTIIYASFDKKAAKKILKELYAYFNTPEEHAPRFELVWKVS